MSGDINNLFEAHKIAELLKTEVGVSLTPLLDVIQEREELRKQVAELEKECSKLRHEEVRLLKQGIEKNARIVELREALERMLLCDVAEVRTIPRSCGALNSVRKALATKDDTQALEAYRNKVIGELEKERGYDPVTISENTMNRYRNAVIDECIDIAMWSSSLVTEMTELKR